MNRCLNCLSENLISIVDKNRVHYKCKNCGSSNARILDSDRQIFSKKINGLTAHVTVAALVKKNDKYLLLNRSNFPFGFALPTGHLEYNETVNKSIARELFEETGLVINHKKLILHETFNDSCKNGGELHEWYLYECSCIGDVKLNNESSEYVWAAKEKIENLDLAGTTKYALSRAKIIDQIDNEDDFKRRPSINRRSNESQKRAKIEQSALEGLPIPLLIFDKRNKMYYSNSNATKLLLTLRKDETNYANLQQMFESLSHRVIESQGDLSANFHFDKDKVLNIIASPLLVDENICGATITLKDVTDQKMHEARDLLAYKSSLALSSHASSSEIIKTLLKQTLDSLNITGCSLMVLEKDILKVIMRYSIYEQKKRKPLELKIGEGAAGWVAEKKTPLAIPNTGDDPSFIGSSKIQEKSLLSVPVLSGKDILGVLNISKKRGLFFSEEEMKIITTVSNRIAIALENQKLYQELYNDKKTLETVLGTSTDGLILINRDLKLVFANAASQKINGLTDDEIKNHHINHFLAKTSKKNTRKFISLVDRAITKKKRVTTNFVSEKGPTKIVRTIFNPIIEKKGYCDTVLIGFNDITKIKLREKMIQKQVAQITSLFKISAISIENSHRFYKQILEKTAEITNSKEADLFLSGDDKTFNNASVEEYCNLIKLTADPNEKSCIINDPKSLLSQKSGSRFSRILAAPINIQKKTVGYLVVNNKKNNYSSHDSKLLSIIAGRVSSKIETDNHIKELKSDQQKISEIINNTGDGILVRNPKGEVTLCNKAWAEMVGFDDLKQYDKRNPGVDDRFEQIKEYAQRNQFKTLHRRIKIKNADGQDLWLQITDSFIHSTSKLEYVISLVRDVTREEELDNQQKEFIYTATHELRTPITAIRGYLSMILNGDAGPVNPKQTLYFKRASQSTDKLVSLVEDLLKVARIEENKVQFEDKAYSAQKLVKEVVSDFKAKATAKQINLDAEIVKDFKLQGDYEKTKQALSNLVDNAIKYTKKGKVEIVAKEKINGLGDIQVIDSGLGITKKEQSFIFNKFYRVFNSETIKAGGTGLGLFIVKNLIEKQGGRVEVESQAGKGSKFTLSLPLDKK